METITESNFTTANTSGINTEGNATSYPDLTFITEENATSYHDLTSITLAVPVIAVLGITGNILVIIIMLRARFKRLSSPVYFMMLAMTDATLLVLYFIHIIFQKAGVMYNDKYSVICMLLYSSEMGLSSAGAWILLAVSVERYLIASLEMSLARQVCTRRNAFIFCTVILTFFSVVYTTVTQALKAPNLSLLNHIYHYGMVIFHFVLCVIVPGLGILVCSILLIYNLVYKKRRMLGRQAQISCYLYMTRVLVINISSFIFLFTPVRIQIFFGNEVFNPIAMCLGALHHAINPILYPLCGAMYRAELIKLLCHNTELQKIRCYFRKSFCLGKTISNNDGTNTGTVKLLRYNANRKNSERENVELKEAGVEYQDGEIEESSL